jgi:hypothetical protein
MHWRLKRRAERGRSETSNLSPRQLQTERPTTFPSSKRCPEASIQCFVSQMGLESTTTQVECATVLIILRQYMDEFPNLLCAACRSQAVSNREDIKHLPCQAQAARWMTGRGLSAPRPPSATRVFPTSFCKYERNDKGGSLQPCLVMMLTLGAAKY